MPPIPPGLGPERWALRGLRSDHAGATAPGSAARAKRRRRIMPQRWLPFEAVAPFVQFCHVKYSPRKFKRQPTPEWPVTLASGWCGHSRMRSSESSC
jgi:hypothetical protein